MKQFMTNDDDPTVARLRHALDELAAGMEPGPPPSALPMIKVTPDRRSRRAPRVLVGAGASVLVLAVVGALLAADRDDGASPVASVAPTTLDDAGLPVFDLDLEGAVLYRDVAGTPITADATVWSDGHRVLSLSVKPGAATQLAKPSSAGAVTEVGRPAAGGRMWVTDPTGTSRSILLWWSRPDGDLYLFQAHWYDGASGDDASHEEELERWAGSVQVSMVGDGPEALRRYTIADADMVEVASEQAGMTAERHRGWAYRGSDINLTVSAGAPASSVAGLAGLGWPQPYTVFGRSGYLVDHSDGSGLSVSWPVDDTGSVWATLGLSESTASRTDLSSILAAVVPAGAGTAAPAAPAVGPLPTSPAPESSTPSLAYLTQWDRTNAEPYQRFDAAVWDCMADLGYPTFRGSYGPPVWQDDADVRMGSHPYRPHSLARARDQGYGISTFGGDGIVEQSPLDQYLGSLGADGSRAFLDALGGFGEGMDADGCEQQAWEASFDHQTPEPVFGLLLEVEARVASEPSVVEAHREWAACMAEAGFPYESPAAAVAAITERNTAVQSTRTGLDDPALEALRTEERATATADFRCFDEHVVDIEAAVRPAIEADLLADSPEAAAYFELVRANHARVADAG